jgi:serine/threonine protein kinase
MVETEKSTIDQFVLIKKIGEGGYGDAFKAYDVKTNDVVCVKIFHNHSKKFQEVWEAELEPGKRQFDHENILKVICAGQGDFFKNGKNKGCKLYIVSEYGCNG